MEKNVLHKNVTQAGFFTVYDSKMMEELEIINRTQ